MPSTFERRPRARPSRIAVYVSAAISSIAVAALIGKLSLPAFVFEHLIVLLVVGSAILAGRGPAFVVAVSASLGDNLVLREPIGRPVITGVQDVVDLALLLMVAIVISWLVDSLRIARARAVDAAERERRARAERDRFVATMTHDLATPLNIILGTIRFVCGRVAISGVDVMPELRRIETAAMRATSLFRTLADSLSIEQGALRLVIRPIDFRAVVESVARMFDGTSVRHPIVLAMEPGPLVVSGDAERLRRLVENLVTNAIKYSPRGGPVEISVGSEGESAVLCVRDHGIGIPPDAAHRLFQIGYRTPEAAMVAPGLGLGLHIAAAVVSQHGGSITATSAHGGGTLFTVRLPLVPDARRSEDYAVAVDIPRSSSLNAVH